MTANALSDIVCTCDDLLSRLQRDIETSAHVLITGEPGTA